MPSSRAACAARSTLAERPEVEIATSTSPLRPSAAQLALEHLVERVVVGDAGQRRAVGRQRQRGQRAPIVDEAPGEFRRQVLAVGGRAAIAAKHQFPAAAQGVAHA